MGAGPGTQTIQGLELPSPDPPGPGCQAGHGASIVLYPAVLRDESVNDFLHGQVGDELFLGQRAPGHRVKVAHTLQVLLNVLAVIGDTTGCNAGFPHQLKANLATQVVRDISLL